MKNKILEALKTKFDGVDASTLGRIADKLAKTTTDEAGIQTAVDGVTFQQVMESYGDARVTKAQQTAVENYEKKHGLKDGKPIQAEPPKPEPQEPPKPNDEPEYIKAMRQQMEAMQKRLDEADKAKTTSGRRSKLDAMLKDAPETIRTLYTQNFEAMTFADDAAFDTWLDGSKTSVESLTATFNAKNGITTPPKTGGGGGNQPNPLVVARAEKAAKPSPNAIIGAPAQEAK